jgi:hypothetical protein
VLLGLAVDRGRLLGLSHLPPGGLLALVVCGALDLPALLKTVIIVSAHFDAIFVVGTYRATTSWYFQPNSCPRRPTVQYLRPGFNLSTLRAWGTTTRFFLSYGGGIRRSSSAPWRRYRGRSCGESCRGRYARTSWRGRGNGRVLMRSAVLMQPCSSLEYIPPRVGLKRVCLRMKAEYFTVVVVSTRSFWC